MNNAFLATTIASLIGTTVMINGLTLSVDDILGETKSVVNRANIHQLATVLEIYYSDNNRYPLASGGEALISELSQKGYIRNEPLEPSVFNYEAIENGQEYKLDLK